MTAEDIHTYAAGRTSWATSLDVRALVMSLRRHRELVWHLVRRNVAARYRGAFLGVGWTVLQPLLMLVVYTYVFGVVFHARWHGDAAGYADFALAVFCGLIPFNFLAECAGAAPGIVLANTNYVKRVVFPLELLPVVVVGSALVVAAVNTAVLLAAGTILVGPPPLTALLLPLAALPCVLLGLALAWGLAMLGVFVRDTPSVVAFLTQVAFFLTPIVYPEEAVPEHLRALLHLNPLAAIVTAWRGLALGTAEVPWVRCAALTLAAMLLALAGRSAFVRAQRAFADVL